jgi:hypothetical protein
MVKPADHLEWCVSNPDPGTNVIQPSGAKQIAGWADLEAPYASHFNWLFNTQDAWNKYFEEVTDDVIALTDEPVTAVSSSPLTLTAADTRAILLVDTSAARTINLPTPASGLRFTMKDKTGQAGTNAITLARAGSEKIEGVAANYTLEANWGKWTIVSDGTDWFFI